MPDFKYRSTFTTVAKVISPSEEDRFIAKASLAPLRSLIPADATPELDSDLMYIASNGAVAGLVNKNGDAVSCATALAIYKTAKNKYISMDHDRDKVVGVILYNGLSRFGDNTILTDEEAAALKEPFNMSFAGVLWRVVNPGLAKYINNTGDDNNPDSLSMSWEIAFNSYDIGVGSKNTFDANVIKAEDPSFSTYDKYIRGNGGSGKDAAGREVFRIINGDPLILGYSIVPNPAADVKGILPVVKEQGPTENPVAPASIDLSEIPESQRSILEGEFDAEGAFDYCDITMADGTTLENIPMLNRRYLPKNIDVKNIASIKKCDKNAKKIITPVNERVTINIAKTMKIDSIEQLESQWAEIRKLESAAAVADFVKAIKDGSDKFVAEQTAKDELVKNAEAAKKESEARAAKLEAKLDEATKILGELRAKAESAEAMQVFNDRMATLDSEFDLDDEDRKILASDVQALADDAAFAGYVAKCKVLMKGKAKKAKKADDDGDGDDETDAKKHTKPSDTAGSEASVAAEAIASVKEDEKEVIIKPTVTVEETIGQKMSAAFGGSLKINGKPVIETKK